MGAKTRRNFRFCVESELVAKAHGLRQATSPTPQQQRAMVQAETRRKRIEEAQKAEAEEQAAALKALEQDRRLISCDHCMKKTHGGTWGSLQELNWFRVGQCTGYCAKCSTSAYVKRLDSCGCQTGYNPTGKLMFCDESCWTAFSKK